MVNNNLLTCRFIDIICSVNENDSTDDCNQKITYSIIDDWIDSHCLCYSIKRHTFLFIHSSCDINLWCLKNSIPSERKKKFCFMSKEDSFLVSGEEHFLEMPFSTIFFRSSYFLSLQPWLLTLGDERNEWQRKINSRI